MNILSLTGTGLGSRGISWGLLGGLAPVPTIARLVCLSSLVFTGAQCSGEVRNPLVSVSGETREGALLAGRVGTGALVSGWARCGGNLSGPTRLGACVASLVRQSGAQVTGEVRVGAQCSSCTASWGGTSDAIVRTGASVSGEVREGALVTGECIFDSCDC